MSTVNLILTDNNKIIKNQLKMPYYGELKNPIIILEGQESIGPFIVNSFPEKLLLLKHAIYALFTGKFQLFTKVTK